MYNLLSNVKVIFMKNKLGIAMFKLIYKNKQKYSCPICKYSGPFGDIHTEIGIRKHASCPQCRSLERHRIQYLVIEKLAENYDFKKMSILHFAPEPFFRQYFKNVFEKYTSADLLMKDVDYKADLLNLFFPDKSFDFIFASHVLEHIKEDLRALSEIRRILKPNGIAILPVPIVAYKTVEYPEPNPNEIGHVRAPGPDYLEKYSIYFSKVEMFSSNNFPAKYQTFVYEDRTGFPNEKMPLRPSMAGDKHLEFVPVCFA